MITVVFLWLYMLPSYFQLCNAVWDWSGLDNHMQSTCDIAFKPKQGETERAKKKLIYLVVLTSHLFFLSLSPSNSLVTQMMSKMIWERMIFAQHTHVNENAAKYLSVTKYSNLVKMQFIATHKRINGFNFGLQYVLWISQSYL